MGFCLVGFCFEGFCPVGFCPVEICPMGFCHVGFCPDTPSNTSSSLFCLVGNTDVEETTNR